MTNEQPMPPSAPFACKRCGETVWWDTSKRTGGRYLAQRKIVGGCGDGGARWSKSIKIPHVCDSTTIANHEAQLTHAATAHADALAAGQIIVGQHVIVARGRKVPRGATGIVFWRGDSTYGERIGIKIDGSDEKVFTALQNVDVAPTTGGK